MPRSTAFSARFSLLKSGFAGAFVLSIVLSCSDSTSPTADADGVIRIKVGSVDIVVPDSIKQGYAVDASATSMVPMGPVANVLVAPGSAAASAAAAACGGGGAFQGYTKSRVAFTPEDIPDRAPYPLTEDGYIPASFVPLGFNFSFQGNTYSSVNVFSNGFLVFGTPPNNPPFIGGAIPSVSNPNNMIALGWTDWSPQLVADGIRFQTRGSAPNRRFILQYNNVPEYNSASRVNAIVGSGRLMTQVVLSEGSNDITIYTNSMVLVNSTHLVTQGIENLAGTQANYDSVLNVALNRQLPRVRNFFRLDNDAVRFSLIQTRDEEKPTITAPDNLTVGNDPGLASAVVAVGSPVAADNCVDVRVTSVRSDGKAVDAPYPVGVTTITWTATDAAGNSASVTQSITVLDIEPPVFGATRQAVLEVNATSPSGAVVTFNDLNVTDNVGVTSLSCVPASGSVFAVGTTLVTCTAADAAGNTSSRSFPVNVVGAHEQIRYLMDHLNIIDLPNGTAQPLYNQLKLAFSQTADGGPACAKVGDFLSLVQKKSSNISPAEVTYLSAEANRILDVMDCAPPTRALISTTTASYHRISPQ